MNFRCMIQTCNKIDCFHIYYSRLWEAPPSLSFSSDFLTPLFFLMETYHRKRIFSFNCQFPRIWPRPSLGKANNKQDGFLLFKSKLVPERKKASKGRLFKCLLPNISAPVTFPKGERWRTNQTWSQGFMLQGAYDQKYFQVLITMEALLRAVRSL